MSLPREITINGNTIPLQTTLADRLVNWVDPIKGQARLLARVRMAINGGYLAGRKDRNATSSWRTSDSDADTVILPDLETMRERSQDLLRNSPLALGAIKTNVTKVVGTGLKVKSQIDRGILKNLTPDQADAWERAAEREFVLATETREIDAERTQPLSLLAGLAFLKVLEDGDVLVNMPRFTRTGSPYSLKLQLIEAARLCNRDRAANTSTMSGGVEKDAYGAPVAYHVLKSHPGNMLYANASRWEWMAPIPVFGKLTGLPQCLHLMDKTRPNQSRGVPYLAPVVELFKQLGRYTDAEVMAAVITGSLSVFITSEMGQLMQGTASTDPAAIGNQLEIGDGAIVRMQPGEKIETVTPGRPNQAFDPFIQAVLRQIGVALEVPFELLVKHFTASYSASRAALLEAWDYFNRRRHWLAVSLYQPVYEAVITEAVASGRLSAPGFLSSYAIRRAYLGTAWIGDAPGQIDPLKEINAAEKRMALHLTTHSEECAALPHGGSDWEAKFPKLRREKAMLAEAGLAASDKQTSLENDRQVDDEGDEP